MNSTNNDFLRQKKCLTCGHSLTGRTDKKFCDSQCRNTYYNRFKREDQKYIQNVNSLIRKNRSTLRSLCPIGKATVRKDVLDALAYDFRYFSGMYKSSSGQVYYICYDYAFSPIVQKGIQKVLIIQKQNYFDSYKPQLWP